MTTPGQLPRGRLQPPELSAEMIGKFFPLVYDPCANINFILRKIPHCIFAYTILNSIVISGDEETSAEYDVAGCPASRSRRDDVINLDQLIFIIGDGEGEPGEEGAISQRHQ